MIEVHPTGPLSLVGVFRFLGNVSSRAIRNNCENKRINFLLAACGTDTNECYNIPRGTAIRPHRPHLATRSRTVGHIFRSPLDSRRKFYGLPVERTTVKIHFAAARMCANIP